MSSICMCACESVCVCVWVSWRKINFPVKVFDFFATLTITHRFRSVFPLKRTKNDEIRSKIWWNNINVPIWSLKSLLLTLSSFSLSLACSLFCMQISIEISTAKTKNIVNFIESFFYFFLISWFSGCFFSYFYFYYTELYNKTTENNSF